MDGTHLNLRFSHESDLESGFILNLLGIYKEFDSGVSVLDTPKNKPEENRKITVTLQVAACILVSLRITSVPMQGRECLA